MKISSYQTKSAVVVVGNFRYLLKYLKNFIINLENKGNYKGDVVVLTSKFSQSWVIKKIIKYPNLHILKPLKIRFPKKTKEQYLKLDTGGQPNRFKFKNFQWFKLNIFSEDMKYWQNILYLDINLTIHYDINGIFKLNPQNYFYAKADSYPEYKTTLSTQFDSTHVLYKKLQDNFDLQDVRYFQTGLMYFNTSIIKKNMIQEIIDLAIKYPISITNEQGVLNLYFQQESLFYKEIPEHIDGRIFYYYWMVGGKEITITKQLVEKYK